MRPPTEWYIAYLGPVTTGVIGDLRMAALVVLEARDMAAVRQFSIALAGRP
jgi:hypothetical protein